jgi:hypothetical protein
LWSAVIPAAATAATAVAAAAFVFVGAALAGEPASDATSAAAGAAGAAAAAAGAGGGERGQLVQVHNDFSTDPHWEGINNRVEAENPPTKKQNFGWRPGPREGADAGAGAREGADAGGGAGGGAGAGGGEVGGIIWRSRTPAWYGMKVGPFSFDDKLSASGTIRMVPGPNRDGGYIGFFNSTRQEWRPWSSMAARVGAPRMEPNGELSSDFTLDYMSTGWRAGGFGVGRFPWNNKPQKWSWTYEPDVTITGAQWPDPRLKGWLGDKRVPEETLLERARADEAAMTADHLRALLEEAQYRGLIEFQTRRGVGWQLRDHPEDWKGRIVATLGDQPRQTHFINKAIREQGLVLDRFGIFNFQLPGDDNEFYLANLTVNGKKIDLSKDPHWQGKNNTLQFVEKDFHGRLDFGFSPTNLAGKAPGEIGGTFWRTEANDPIHGYYADPIGTLTMDDPISFSGSMVFTKGGSDAGMFFGYFRAKDQMIEIDKSQGGEAGAPLPNMMGFAIDGPTRIGYYFSTQLTPAERSRTSFGQGPVFVPDGKRHHFTFRYDPAAAKGAGQIHFTLDGTEYAHNIDTEQRKSGATFDRFGLLNIRRGGKYVEMYFDDMTYTARPGDAAKQSAPPEHVVRVPYPPHGRKY